MDIETQNRGSLWIDLFQINSLWPSDAILRHISGSTLAQVMAGCMTAPNHCLNQYWLLISKVLGHSHESNFLLVAKPLFFIMSIKIVFQNYCHISQRPMSELTHDFLHMLHKLRLGVTLHEICIVFALCSSGFLTYHGIEYSCVVFTHTLQDCFSGMGVIICDNHSTSEETLKNMGK